MNAVLDQEIPDNLSVTLPVTPEIASQIRLSGALAVAEAYGDVAEWTHEVAQAASQDRTEWARQIDVIKKMRDGFVVPARKLLEHAAALFGPPIEEREQARTLLGQKLLGWNTLETQRIAIENAKREEEARKARQAAEAQAAAEMARAEQTAADARRKADEAEQARRKAEAEGNARAAAAAAAEAAKLAEKAQAAIETGAARAAEVQLQAAAFQAIPVAQAKIEGSSVKDNWIAELTVTEDECKALIAAEAASRPELLAMLKLDMSAASKMAKALRGAMRVPGMKAVNKPILAGARK